MNIFNRTGFLLFLTAALLAGSSYFASAAEVFSWNPTRNRLTVDVEGWQLEKLLQKITDATDWQVYVDPEARFTRPLSARFHNLPTGEAFRRLFGDLSFAVLPQRDQPPTLYVFKTSVDNATRRIMPRAAEDRRIRGELIVRLKNGSDADINDLARRLGAKVVGSIDALDAHRLRFADENAAERARDALKNDSSVESVENNHTISRPGFPDAVPIASAPPLNIRAAAGPDGSRIIIALIDTPVQSNAPYNDFLLPAIHLAGEAETGFTAPTHGTSMFETILRGVSQSNERNAQSPIRVLPVDVYGNAGSTTTFDVARGVVTAVENGATIVNLSLGSQADSGLLQNVIQQGADKGVTFVAAAGNQPTTLPTYPAAYPDVLAVTAGNRNGDIADYANRGSFVDAVAPGGNLVHYSGNSFYVSGTSASTAFISGVAGAMAATGADTAAIKSGIADLFGVGKK